MPAVDPFPLCTRERTSSARPGMSVLCHQRTYSIIRSLGRHAAALILEAYGCYCLLLHNTTALKIANLQNKNGLTETMIFPSGVCNNCERLRHGSPRWLPASVAT